MDYSTPRGTPAPIANPPAPRKRISRLGRIAVPAAVGAVLVNLAIWGWLGARRAPASAASPVFASSPVIRELQGLAADLPRDPEVNQRLGAAYLQQGHYLSAIESLQGALRLGGPEAPIRRLLSVAFAGVDRYEEALEHLARLRVMQPDQLDLPLHVAAHQVSLGRPEDARKTLDHLPRDAQGYPGQQHREGPAAALERLAGAYGELGVYDSSLKLARLAIRDHPERPAGHLVAGRALLELGKAAAAIPHLERVDKSAPGQTEVQLLLVRAWKLAGKIENESRVMAALESLAKSGGASGQVYMDLGIIYERRKQSARAGDAFKQAYESKVDPAIVLPRAYTNYAKAGRVEDAIYLEGLLYENRADWPRAMTQYRKLAGIHSCCHSGYMHLARVQGKMGRAREALKTLQRARAITGAPPKLFAELARTYRVLNQPNQEQAMWREFIRRDATNADLGYQQLGVLADKAGKIDEAERHYRKCVELQPTADLYWAKLGKLLIQRRSDPRRLRDGIAALERAVELAPAQAEHFLELAAAYRYAQRAPEAIWSARHSVDLDPGDGRGYQQIGEVLMAAGRRAEGEQALAYFRRFRQYYQAWETLRARVRRSPRDLGAKHRMAQFYERSGSVVNAVKTYAEILEHRPGDAQARRRLLALRQKIRAAESL